MKRKKIGQEITQKTSEAYFTIQMLTHSLSESKYSRLTMGKMFLYIATEACSDFTKRNSAGGKRQQKPKDPNFAGFISENSEQV